MSLAIEASKVERVLLADGWHRVEPGSFGLDSYEYVDGNETIHKGGASGIAAVGFSFRDNASKAIMAGPLTSVVAVGYSTSGEKYSS